VPYTNEMTMCHRRRMCTIFLCALAALGAGAGAAAQAQAAEPIAPAVTDWTAVSANTASGTLLGTSVSLSGTHVWNTPTSVLDGSWPYFGGPDFSPALPKSDEIQISGAPGYSYTIRFGAPITNPILELGSLGSRINFPSGTHLTRLSGESGFTVAGASVSGTPRNTIDADGLNDASGTIRLSGTYTTISFTTTPNYSGPEDGILVQLVVAQPEFTDWTAVSSNTAGGTLLGTSVSLSGTHVWNTPTSVLDGSWPYFGGPDFSPALPLSDEIQISGAPGYSYTIRFGAAITDPILELGSLGSRINFASGTRLTRLSGESGFTVSGSSVSGTPTNTLGRNSLNDASGTIKLSGTYTTIGFTTTPNYSGPEDGILVQLGSVPTD
jgi:hypothetical protein